MGENGMIPFPFLQQTGILSYLRRSVFGILEVGEARSSKRHVIRKVIDSYQLHVSCIAETKISRINDSFVYKLWNSSNIKWHGIDS